VRGLFPAGEGASYAGGILSAGVDGIRVAEAVARAILRDAGRAVGSVATPTPTEPPSANADAIAMP
jgi:hypothetical protein